MIHHHPPSLPPSSSVPSISTTSPTLPNELIFNILKRLAEDKPSLAKCMRVSSTFNEITGPILYTTIVLDGLGTTPYDTTKWLPVRARLSQGPLENTELIKNVILLPHTSPEFVEGLIRRQSSVDTLRLPILDLNEPCVSEHTGTYGYLQQSFEHRSLLVESFNPKKLIVFDSRVYTEYNKVSANRDLHTLFFLISPTSSVYTHGNSFQYSNHTGIKKIVHTIWPANTLGACSPHPLYEYRYPAISGFMGYFSMGVRSSIKDYHQLEDITIVNGGQLHHSVTGMRECLSRRDRDAQFEKVVLDALVRLGKHQAKDQQGHYTFTYGVRIINIVFVSLREYFKTFDWSGEFTAEEARPWLESSDEKD